jgi:hypothetical protein
MLIRSESPDSTISMQSLPLLTIMNQWSVKPQASRNSILRKSKDRRTRRATTHERKRRWRSAEHGKISPMAKMPQALESEDRERVGKIATKVGHNLERARRKLYRPRTKMPSLSCALSPNRNAIPLLVIRRHPSIRSI